MILFDYMDYRVFLFVLVVVRFEFRAMQVFCLSQTSSPFYYGYLEDRVSLFAQASLNTIFPILQVPPYLG
jgi:hypothetical protein